MVRDILHLTLASELGIELVLVLELGLRFWQA